MLYVISLQLETSVRIVGAHTGIPVILNVWEIFTLQTDD